MASGLGSGWVVEPRDAEVAVAAIPNSVDRSARLEGAQPPVRACLPLVQPVPGALLTFDVLVEEGNTTAQLTLAGVEDDLTIALSGEGGRVSSGAGLLAHLQAIDAGSWYRVSLDTEASNVRIGSPESGAIGQLTAFSVLVPTATYEQICISTEGDAGAAAYFNNITVEPKGVTS